MAGLTELHIDDLVNQRSDFDAAVDRGVGIDRTCSSSDWVVPAYRTWSRSLEPRIFRSELGWATLCYGTSPSGVRFLGPPEPMWGFGCPIISEQPEQFVAELANHLSNQDDWDSLFIPGLAPHGPIRHGLANHFQEQAEVFAGARMIRCRATLPASFDAYLNTYPSKRRRELQRILRRAEESDVRVIDGLAETPDHDELFARIIAVELESWKGRDGSGMVEPELHRFYRAMVDQLPERIRIRFAQIEGRDVGYVFGQTRGPWYRGLQISYDDSFSELSLGSLLQLSEIRELIDLGIAHYDLGMAMDYKQRWATESFITASVMISRTAT